LVDANLTARSGARERLAATLHEHGVHRLRFVCITHFDADHIRGLGTFLREHFGPNDRGRHTWEIEQIILPVRRPVIWQLLSATTEAYEIFFSHNDEGTVAFRELFDTLRDIHNSRPEAFRITYAPLTKLTSPDQIPRPAPLGCWDVRFLGPSTHVEDVYGREFQDLFGLDPWEIANRPESLREKIERNETSRIIVLCHRDTKDALLLTGDALASSLEEALLNWTDLKDDLGSRVNHFFRAVKASHHGAFTERTDDNCHLPSLYLGECLTGHSHVIVTCRDHDPSHPHDRMMDTVISAKLECRSTGASHSPSPATMLHRPGVGVPMGSRHFPGTPTEQDIVIRCGPGIDFSVKGGHRRN
jgi:hypothetical protein